MRSRVRWPRRASTSARPPTLRSARPARSPRRPSPRGRRPSAPRAFRPGPGPRAPCRACRTGSRVQRSRGARRSAGTQGSSQSDVPVRDEALDEDDVDAARRRRPGRRRARRRSARSGSPAWCPPSAAASRRPRVASRKARWLRSRSDAPSRRDSGSRARRGRRGDVGHGPDHPQDDERDDLGDDDRLRRARDPRPAARCRSSCPRCAPSSAPAGVTSRPRSSIGAGASAVATILFTDALIGHSDFITPVVIQKMQPLIAIGAAALLLGERPRPGFWWFFLPALAGFWLVNQSHPLEPSAKGLVVIAEATAAAVLWGARDGARALHVPRARVPARPEPALLLRAARERDRAARHGRTRLLERPRQRADPLPRARHRAARADALLLRAAAHAGRSSRRSPSSRTRRWR